MRGATRNGGSARNHKGFAIFCRNGGGNRNPYRSRRSGHCEQYAHHNRDKHAHEYLHRNACLNCKRHRDADVFDEFDKRPGNEHRNDAHRHHAERNENDVEFGFPGVKPRNLNREKRDDVRTDRVAGSAQHKRPRHILTKHAHEIACKRTHKPRDRRREHHERFCAQFVRNAYAYARAHERFCYFCDVCEKMSEAVVTAPGRNLRKYRTRNERAEKPLRHPGKRVYKIAFARLFQPFDDFLPLAFLLSVVGKDTALPALSG